VVLAHLGLAAGVGLGLVGTATATDAVSLREVASSLDVPLVSAAVYTLRESMSTDLAHTLEALAAMVGGTALLLPFVRRAQLLAFVSWASRPSPTPRARCYAQRQ